MAMKKLLLALTVWLSGAGLAQEASSDPALRPSVSTSLPAESAVITHWDQQHPAAASTLASLVRDNPKAAGRMFMWDRDHPRRAQAFLAWINGRPNESLDDFVSAHHRWPVIQLVIEPYRATFEAFIAWGRAHPRAAQDLASEPRGLAWVGFHTFGGLWDAKAPQAPTDGPESAGLPVTPPPAAQR